MQYVRERRRKESVERPARALRQHLPRIPLRAESEAPANNMIRIASPAVTGVTQKLSFLFIPWTILDDENDFHCQDNKARCSNSSDVVMMVWIYNGSWLLIVLPITVEIVETDKGDVPIRKKYFQLWYMKGTPYALYDNYAYVTL